MSEMLCRTKNGDNPKGKPRILFTCHTDNFDVCFDKICTDILSIRDCAIYYTEDMTESILEKETDIESNNLLVIPITKVLLTTENRAINEDLPYALKTGVPVLPILMEHGVELLYEKNELFSDLQYLNPFSTDKTEIPYAVKLEKYLRSVLFSEQNISKIREAFDAYIFLSYRKKDRVYANKLMRMIHSYSECRDIAIWFDEFLVPGESFSTAISEMLEKSDIFALLVTPRLLENRVNQEGIEEENYVLSVELPLAKKQEKLILPVEMEQTDKGALQQKDITECVDSNDEKEFKNRLLRSISRIAFGTDKSNPEHSFLIGLAYCDGIDVEVDREKGFCLISSAAEAGLPEAMRELGRMYMAGKGTTKSYFLADLWYKRFTVKLREDVDSVEDVLLLMDAYDEYCDFLSEHAVFDYSLFVNNTMLPYIMGAAEGMQTILEKYRGEVAYWLCCAYYRSVHADMSRDADDHNAADYMEKIEWYSSYIVDPIMKDRVADYLNYMKDAISFWDEFVSTFEVSNRSGSKGSENKMSLTKILEEVSRCEKLYVNDPNEDVREELMDALEKVTDYYEKTPETLQWFEFASRYLALKKINFRDNPESLEAMDIIWHYDNVAERLLNENLYENAILILSDSLEFYEYLFEIGAEPYVDYNKTLEQLADVYEIVGEHGKAVQILQRTRNQ